MVTQIQTAQNVQNMSMQSPQDAVREERANQRLAVLGVAGGAKGIPIKHPDVSNSIHFLLTKGVGIVKAVKLLPYLTTDSEGALMIADKVITPLELQIDVSKLPAPFRQALDAEPVPTPTFGAFEAVKPTNPADLNKNNAPTTPLPTKSEAEKPKNDWVLPAVAVGVALLVAVFVYWRFKG